MTKTSDEVIAEALRMIGVLNLEDDPQTADAAQGLVHLNALYAELDDTHAIAPEWTVDTVPERLFLPLSTALAGSLALQYTKPQFVSLRSKGINMIRADEFGNKPEAAPRAVYY